MADDCTKIWLSGIDLPNISERFQATFGASRSPYSIVQYLAGLKELQDAAVEVSAQNFVREVLEESFDHNRLDPQKNVHLEALEKQQPGILTAWGMGSTRSLVDLETQYLWEPNAWLKDRVVGFGHLMNARRRAPILYNYLAAEPNDLRRQTAVAQLQDAKNMVFQTPQERAWNEVSLACLALSAAPPNEHISALRHLNNCMQALEGEHEFAEDASSQLRSLTLPKPSKKQEDFIGLDTSDPIHLMLSGTEIPGSCQRIGGHPNLNKGLLGYLENGQTRLLAVVKADTGVIQSRCIFRLLLTDDHQPVLFVEQLYGDPSYAPDLLAIARNKAQQMGLPLTIAKPSLSQSPPLGRLNSLGGRAPFEYCDAIRGLAANSRFSIYTAQPA